MGANFISICHCCKEYLFHLRKKEKLWEFYKDHYNCGRKNHKNVYTAWDYFEEPAYEYAQEHYKDVFEKYYGKYGERIKWQKHGLQPKEEK